MTGEPQSGPAQRGDHAAFESIDRRGLRPPVRHRLQDSPRPRRPPRTPRRTRSSDAGATFAGFASRIGSRRGCIGCSSTRAVTSPGATGAAHSRSSALRPERPPAETTTSGWPITTSSSAFAPPSRGPADRAGPDPLRRLLGPRAGPDPRRADRHVYWRLHYGARAMRDALAVHGTPANHSLGATPMTHHDDDTAGSLAERRPGARARGRPWSAPGRNPWWLASGRRGWWQSAAGRSRRERTNRSVGLMWAVVAAVALIGLLIGGHRCRGLVPTSARTGRGTFRPRQPGPPRRPAE